jgi:D-xylose transport system substrate-binding protein
MRDMSSDMFAHATFVGRADLPGALLSPRKAGVMRKTTVGLIGAGVALAVTITGCSSSKKSSGGSSGGSKSGTIGVILPDTVTSTRYTLYDAPLITKAITNAGYKADVQNAQGSNDKFASIAQTMINEGVKVLIIDPPDPSAGVSVEKKAQSAGIPVIDYDRLNLGGSANYYVSFDNQDVGVQQANGLLKCLSAEKNPPKPAQIIQLNGGTDIDNNATLFKNGANSVLTKAQADGTIKVVSSTDVSKWDNTVAKTDFQQALTSNGGKVDGVLAANDGIAGSAISVLKTQHLVVPVTGQDATVQGLQYVIEGDQCLTVFKDVTKEANAVAALALALIKGDKSKAGALATQKLHDPTGNRDVPSYLLKAESIFKDNVKDVIDAGALTAAQICKGIETACQKAGISP